MNVEKIPPIAYQKAQKLPSSPGKRKLRYSIWSSEGLRDAKKHFDIAMEESKIQTMQSDKFVKKGLFHHKVALKIGTNNGKNEYVILNINSLSKRLGLTKKEIRIAEKSGILGEKIKNKMNELQQVMQKIDEIIENLEDIENKNRDNKVKNFNQNEVKLIKSATKTFISEETQAKLHNYFVTGQKEKNDWQWGNSLLNDLKRMRWWRKPEQSLRLLNLGNEWEKKSIKKEHQGEPIISLSFEKAAITFNVSEFGQKERRLLPTDWGPGWVPLNVKELDSSALKEDFYVLAEVKSLVKALGVEENEIKHETRDSIAQRKEKNNLHTLINKRIKSQFEEYE